MKHFFNYNEGVVQENLEKCLDMSTYKIYTESKEWYPKANEKAKEFSIRENRSIEVTSGLISVMSPQKDWHHNLKITDNFLRSYDYRKTNYIGHTQTQIKKALEIISSDTQNNKIHRIHWALGGLKTINFFYNILNPIDEKYATIDSHMIQLMTGDVNRKVVTPKQYNFLKGELIKFAKKENEIPSVMQARLWLTYKENKWNNVRRDIEETVNYF